MFPKNWIYDLETYPNCFTFCGIDEDKKKFVVFEISDRKDERENMFTFLRSVYVNKSNLIGFNNLGFDEPVLQFILKNKDVSVKQIYSKAMSIIESQYDENAKFAHMVKAADRMFNQIDLFKIHHFDNKTRATSLKLIEFNMRSETIEDLPFPVGKVLTDNEKDLLVKYNIHDVEKTIDFYLESKGKIEFREQLSKQYGRSFINHNDSKIGSDIFVDALEKESPGICFNPKTKKVNQTKRKSIDLGMCIFPYVKFERDEFNVIKNWLESQVIYETKGVFTDIPEHQLGDAVKYAKMKEKRYGNVSKKPFIEKQITKFKSEFPLGWIEEKELKSGGISYTMKYRIAETLNTTADGFQFDFGAGGIHGSLSNTQVVEGDEYEIWDWDVSSYYPNLSISNNIYPEHLSDTFCKVYKQLYELRATFSKKSAENLMLKLALNGTYGNSNSEFSPFYDPMYTMKITINGQLSLCMLSEQLMNIEGLTMIQCNTDGLTVKVKKQDVERMNNICASWETLTGLTLESVRYSMMHVRDCNNYVAVMTNGKIKRKGAYEYEGLDWNKNHSMFVVKKAVEHQLLGKGTIEDFIRNHTDIYDFMLRVKLPRSNRLLSVDSFGKESIEQNICRYYISNDGVDLIKVMPPLEGGKTVKVWFNHKTQTEVETDSTAKEKGLEKRIQSGVVTFLKEYYKSNEERRQLIEANAKVTVCNNMKHFKGDINYDYYINRAKELYDFKGDVD